MQQEILIPAENVNGQALLKAEPTPMDLLQMAVQKGVDIDQLTKLMELKERWEANEARKAYNAAMTEFKKDPPTITKNKHVKFGNTEYDHATLDQVTDSITGALSKVGIGHRWDVSQTGPDITVVCILTHAQGHSERTTLKASADNSGSKNPIQAIGSAVTYLQRYTLLLACGMAAKGLDDDGSSAEGVDGGWLQERMDWIANCRNRKELHDIYTAAYKEANGKSDRKATDALIKAKNARYRELSA